MTSIEGRVKSPLQPRSKQSLSNETSVRVDIVKMGLSLTKAQQRELRTCITDVDLSSRPNRVYHIAPILSFKIQPGKGDGSAVDEARVDNIVPFIEALQAVVDPQDTYTHKTDALLWKFQLDLWTRVIVVLRDFLPNLIDLCADVRHVLNAKISKKRIQLRQRQKDVQLLCGVLATHRILCDESDLFTQQGMVFRPENTQIVCQPAKLGRDFTSHAYEMILAAFALFNREELLALPNRLIAVEAQNDGATRIYLTRRAEAANVLVDTVKPEYEAEVAAQRGLAFTHLRQLATQTKLQPAGIYIHMSKETDDVITIFDDDEPETDDQIAAAKQKRLDQAEMDAVLREIKAEAIEMPGDINDGEPPPEQFVYQPNAVINAPPDALIGDGFLTEGGFATAENVTIADINRQNAEGLSAAALAELYHIAQTQPQKLAQVSPAALAKISLTPEQLNRFNPPPRGIKPRFLKKERAAALSPKELQEIRAHNRLAITTIRQLEDSPTVALNLVDWLSAIHFVDTDCSNYTKNNINDAFLRQVAATIEEEANRPLGDFGQEADARDLEDYDKYGRLEFPLDLYLEQWQSDRARRAAAVLQNMDLFQAAERHEKRDVTQAQYLRMGSKVKYAIVNAYWKQLVKMYDMRVSKILIDNRRAFTAACRITDKLAELKEQTNLVANARIIQERLIMMPTLKYHIVKRAMRQLYQLADIKDHHKTGHLPECLLLKVRDATVNKKESMEIQRGIVGWLADREHNPGMTIRGMCDEMLTGGKTLSVVGQARPEIILTALHLDHYNFDAKAASLKLRLQSEEPGKSGKGLNSITTIKIVPVDDEKKERDKAKGKKVEKDRRTMAVVKTVLTQANKKVKAIVPMMQEGDTFKATEKKEEAMRQRYKKEVTKMRQKKKEQTSIKTSRKRAEEAKDQKARDAENKLRRDRNRRVRPMPPITTKTLNGYHIPKRSHPPSESSSESPSPAKKSRSPPTLVIDSDNLSADITAMREDPPTLVPAQDEAAVASAMIAASVLKNHHYPYNQSIEPNQPNQANEPRHDRPQLPYQDFGYYDTRQESAPFADNNRFQFVATEDHGEFVVYENMQPANAYIDNDQADTTHHHTAVPPPLFDCLPYGANPVDSMVDIANAFA